MKDYCTCWWDVYRGIEIWTACKNHDNAVGMRGTYNPFTPHIAFYKDLVDLGVSRLESGVIAWLGAVISWVRYPYFAYKIYKYRRR